MKDKVGDLAKSKSSFLFILSLATTIIISFFNITSYQYPLMGKGALSADKNKVLVQGFNYHERPQIYISGGSYKYSSGGVLPLASTDDPVVEIGGYNVSGKITIDLYEANQEALLSYLVYNDEYQQKESGVDTSGFTFVTTVEHDVNLSGYGSETKVSLPFADRGIYYLRVKIGDTLTHAYVVRSNIGAVVKEGDAEYVFWAQDFRNKRSLTSGNVRIYNFKDEVTELSNVSINDQGIARSFLTADADAALVIQDQEVAIVPINLLYLNTGWSWQRFSEKEIGKRYFTFTDRPLYRPGDTIYFKSIIRDEDDVRYRVPSGSLEVVINRGWGSDENLFERSYPVSETGTINGEYTLPDDVRTGYYQLRVGDEGYIDFEVQEFRKPEYFLDIEAEKREYISSDTAEVTIRGEYFSGEPLAGRKVDYEITSADFYEHTYVASLGRTLSDDYRYGWWYSDNTLDSGSVELDANGQAKLKLPTKLKENEGKSQVVSIEVNLTSSAGEEPAFDRKNLLVYSGEYGIYRKDYSYGTKLGETLKVPFILVPRREGASVSGKELKVKATIEGYERQETGGVVSWKQFKEDVSEFSVKTDSNGESEISFLPKRHGYYTITLTGTDSSGNEIKNTFYAYVRDKDYSYYSYSGKSSITITPDRAEYRPGDTAQLTFYSDTPNRDVFLTFERARVNRYQVFHIDGNSRILSVPIVETDMPNIYVEAVSFSNKALDVGQENLTVSAEKMRLQVEIKPEATVYGPGETSVVTLTTKDENGQPVAADVALWAVDKAIYELTQSRLGNIFDSFWSTRYNGTSAGHSLEGIRVQTAEGGGCFAKGTKVLMADGTTKNIEDVRIGDFVRTRKSPTNAETVRAKILDVYQTEVNGYLLVNGRLRLTDNHKLLVNGLWKEAAEIKIGDVLLNQEGSEYVGSIEWVRGKFTVHNLHVEAYQSFFADNVYVHNQKGGPPREVLKDTAYWNPSIRTGVDGRAVVSVALPDNLTTWAFSAVASTNDTKVGQAKTEVKVTKDVIVRPIIPNILREGDTIILSALVQNFTEEDRTFNVDLRFKAGEVDEPEKTNINIVSGGTYQAFWAVKPNVVGPTSLIFRAYDVNETSLGDTIIREIPVRLFGFEEQRGYAGLGGKDYEVQLAEDAINQGSSLSLTISPTILGSLPSAMEYLIDYPYGCIEQTTSRFVPSIIAKRNSSIFREVLAKKDIDDIIEKGLARVKSLQNTDGGWGWWGDDSDPFISAYVVEYLLEARADGYEVDEAVLENATRFFEYLDSTDSAFKVSRYYALTLLGSDSKPDRLDATDDMDPVILSMLVIANTKNGKLGNDESGLNTLLAKAKRQGDLAYWEPGTAARFGSVSASTGMAIRALVETGEERDLAVKAVRYLSQNRTRHYWENSFATAAVIRAIVGLASLGDEQNPNYDYVVSVNGELFSKGHVGSVDQVIESIDIPFDLLDGGKAKVTIDQEGPGQLYSTLVVKEFRTDRNYKASGPLTVKREIVNEKGSNHTLGVGEVAIVRLTIDGWPSGANYAVVEDHLPSGMVPIIETFRNEQQLGSTNRSPYYYGKEYTEDGVIFNSSVSVQNTYTYRARVVNSGEFYIPPATASLMYSPSVAGTSDAEFITIERQSKELPRSLAETLREKLNQPEFREVAIKAVSVFVAFLIALSVFAYIKRKKVRELLARFKNWLKARKPGKDKGTDTVKLVADDGQEKSLEQKEEPHSNIENEPPQENDGKL